MSRVAYVEGEVVWPIGQRLTSCEYQYLPPDEGVGYEREDPRFDTGLVALRLQFQSDELVLSWAMQGWRQGLAMLDSIDALPSTASTRVAMASQRPWASMLGQSLVEVVPTWHRPSDSVQEFLWAVRLRIGLVRLVVALGAVYKNKLEYMPDELTVIFDESVARNFLIPGAEVTAWGE